MFNRQLYIVYVLLVQVSCDKKCNDCCKSSELDLPFHQHTIEGFKGVNIRLTLFLVQGNVRLVMPAPNIALSPVQQRHC